MKRVIWIGASLLLAIACWGGGALCRWQARNVDESPAAANRVHKMLS